MNIVTNNYNIISFDEVSGKITVQWDYTNDTFDIYLPIEDNFYFTGEPLDLYIRGFFPIRYYERLEEIKSGIPNESDIELLVEVLPDAVVIPTEEIIA